MHPLIFFIVGPTASGKSALAHEVAALTGAEIIGADAFQVYDGLDILTAKPSLHQRQCLPYHLVGEIALTHTFDLGQYVQAAEQHIGEIASRNRPILVVGGTGLYVRSLTHGLADLPPADPQLRTALDAQPLAELQRKLLELDPLGAAQIDMKNPRRLVRALELCTLTGKPFSSLRNEWSQPPKRAHGVTLHLDRELLYQRIDRRADEMFEQGVVEEVQATSDLGPTASQAIGLAPIQALIAGTIRREACLEQIRLDTRRYAKRQITWFRRETTFTPLNLSADCRLTELARRIANQIDNLKGN